MRSSGTVKEKLWQTKEIKPAEFVIVLFSPVFLVWNFILLVVVTYDNLIVLFTISFDYELKGTFIVIDVICMCLLAIDMLVRSRTAITFPNHPCFCSKKVFKHYLNTWFLMDCFAAFPFCYILLISP